MFAVATRARCELRTSTSDKTARCVVRVPVPKLYSSTSRSTQVIIIMACMSIIILDHIRFWTMQGIPIDATVVRLGQSALAKDSQASRVQAKEGKKVLNILYAILEVHANPVFRVFESEVSNDDSRFS